MATPQVVCDVNTCAYNLQGNRCAAGRIEVRNQHRDRTPTGDGDTACGTYRYRRGLGDSLAALTNLNWGGLAREPFHPGRQTSPEVRCGVDNCLHWHEGSCRAEAVQVAGGAATLPGETNCSTFVARDF